MAQSDTTHSSMTSGKPRIIILMHYMELGGAEMSLLGLLSALDPNRVEVDLFIYSHQGPLMNFIPEWVNLLPEVKSYSMIERPLQTALKAGELKIALGRLDAKLKHRAYRKKVAAIGDDYAIMQYVGDCVTPCLPKINPDVEYDLCISYLTPHNIGRDKVRAKKRLAWIHTDYSKVSINARQELTVWDAYDYIASISPDVRKSFVEIFPTLDHKIIDIENIIPENYVRTRAEEFVPELDDSKYKILSIGRFCYPKNFDNVPFICRRLIESGIDAKWYIIGYGGDEPLIRSKIAEAGMEDRVILLGKKDNPYPYIKACDLYVQPSRYEGKSISVREAQILGKPVVITNYPTATSQIKDGIDGVIVPLDNEEAAKGITTVLLNQNLQTNLIQYLTSHDYCGFSEVTKIYALI